MCGSGKGGGRDYSWPISHKQARKGTDRDYASASREAASPALPITKSSSYCSRSLCRAKTSNSQHVPLR